MEDIETDNQELESDAPEASSEPQSEEGGEAREQSPARETKPEPTPFHDHPRFRELVEQKNQALSQTRALEQKLSQLEARINQPASQMQVQKDELLEEIRKNVDPRLADKLEKINNIDKILEKLESLEKRDTQRSRQQEAQTAISKIAQWNDSNKVSEEVRGFMNNQFDFLYSQGKLNLENLEKTYKETYESFKKYEDAIKRTERESYVADKKKDAAVPSSQPKGTPAKMAPKKPTWSKDPEVAKAQIVSRFMKQQAANKEADSV